MPNPIVARKGAMAALGRPLDPDKNNSGKLVRGHYHAQYLEASRREGWGELGARCGGYTLVRFDELTGRAHLVPALCKQFGCALCGPMKAAWLKRNIKRSVGEYGLDQFWTLTLSTKGRTPAESFKQIGGYWDTMKRTLHYHHKQRRGADWRMSYVWTVEPTKRDIAHLHLLTNADDDAGTISRYWLRATGDSYIVDAEPVSTARAGDYLAKYCTEKASLKRHPAYAFLTGKRQFGKSADVEFEPFIAPSEHEGWERLNLPYWEAYRQMAAGAPVVRARHQGAPSASFVSQGVRHGQPVEMWSAQAAADAAALAEWAADLARWPGYAEADKSKKKKEVS